MSAPLVEELKGLRARASRLPGLSLTAERAQDLELLLNGAFAPLEGYLPRRDYERVLDDMRLSNGDLWPLPVQLDVDPNDLIPQGIERGSDVALLHAEGMPLAILRVEDMWPIDCKREAERVYGTTDGTHPGVAAVFALEGRWYLGGKLTRIELPPHHTFPQHHARVFYHARKLASLDPTEEKPVPKIVNLVFTLPPQLHSWARNDSRFFPAFRRSILRTIGEAYGYEGKKGYPVDRAAFKELGAIMNLHAIGDEGTPWPKWNPHYDIIMPAWKRDGNKIAPLRTTWPERYSKTNRRYAENLRHCLLPLAKRSNLLLDFATFLESDFQTDWHVSRPPKSPSNPDRKGIIHVESAMHRIRYSCRPLFLLGSSKLIEEKGGMTLIYRVDKAKGKGQMIHRVPLGPALAQIESLRDWMWGRATRSWAGILSRTTYDECAKLAGHEPVRPKEKKGFVLKVAYELGADKRYIIDDTGRAARHATASAGDDREEDA